MSKQQKLLPYLIFGITVILGVISLVSALTLKQFPLEIFPGEIYNTGAPDTGQPPAITTPTPAMPGGCDAQGNGCPSGWICVGGVCFPPDNPGGNCTPADGCTNCASEADWYDCACAAGSNDPWRCGGDDDDDDDESPPPSSYQCTGLTDPTAPLPGGQAATYTCTGSATNMTITHADFRVLLDGTELPQYFHSDVNLTNNQASYQLQLPADAAHGTYKVQCRICARDRGTCTAWGQAGGVSQVPPTSR